jgi:hypothetical protein
VDERGLLLAGGGLCCRKQGNCTHNAPQNQKKYWFEVRQTENKGAFCKLAQKHAKRGVAIFAKACFGNPGRKQAAKT